MIKKDRVDAQIANGECVEIDPGLRIVVYPDGKRKMRCPHCGNVFDNFLICARGFITCTYCARDLAAVSGLSAAEKAINNAVAIKVDDEWKPLVDVAAKILLSKIFSSLKF